MLKGISQILTPELLKILMEMGHGDELVIGDGNFPAASTAKRANAALVRCDGQNAGEILQAILQFFPLDQYAQADEGNAAVMAVTEQDRQKIVRPPCWAQYEAIIRECGEGASFCGLTQLERFAFYRRAQNAYAVVSSGDSAIYANIILKKGVVLEQGQ